MTENEWFELASEIDGVLNKYGLQISVASGKSGDDARIKIYTEPIEKKHYSKCLRCGRTLKDPMSQERGYGEVCWNKHLLDRQTKLF